MIVLLNNLNCVGVFLPPQGFSMQYCVSVPDPGQNVESSAFMHSRFFSWTPGPQVAKQALQSDSQVPHSERTKDDIKIDMVAEKRSRA